LGPSRLLVHALATSTGFVAAAQLVLIRFFSFSFVLWLFFFFTLDFLIFNFTQECRTLRYGSVFACSGHPRCFTVSPGALPTRLAGRLSHILLDTEHLHSQFVTARRHKSDTSRRSINLDTRSFKHTRTPPRRYFNNTNEQSRSRSPRPTTTQCCKRVELLGEHLVLTSRFLSRQCSTLLNKTRRCSKTLAVPLLLPKITRVDVRFRQIEALPTRFWRQLHHASVHCVHSAERPSGMRKIMFSSGILSSRSSAVRARY
jgi:hypothetical protein